MERALGAERALSAVRSLLSELGGAPDNPRVIHQGANLIVELPENQLVAQVATHTARARGATAGDYLAKSVRISRYLFERGARTRSPARALPAGPHRVQDSWIALWDRVDHDVARALDPLEVAQALREVHQLLKGYAQPPRRLTPILEAQALLTRLDPTRVPPGGLAALQRALHDSLAAIDRLQLDEQPIHGDSSLGNLLLTPTGALWADYEDACTAPIAWDLACLVATKRAFGRPAGDPAEAVLAAYGDVNEADLQPFLRARVAQALVWGLWLERDGAEERVARLLTEWMRGEM